MCADVCAIGSGLFPMSTMHVDNTPLTTVPLLPLMIGMGTPLRRGGSGGGISLLKPHGSNQFGMYHAPHTPFTLGGPIRGHPGPSTASLTHNQGLDLGIYIHWHLLKRVCVHVMDALCTKGYTTGVQHGALIG